MDELTSVFIQESREQLAEMEAGLLVLEQSPDDPGNGELINAIFRAAHTVKGASGVVECHFIENFMHKVENVLDRLRNGEIPVSGGLASLLLKCGDHLTTLIGVLEAGLPEPAPADQATGDALLAELSERYLASAAAGDTAVSLRDSESGEVMASGGGIVVTDSWHISVRFGRDVLRGGMDPLSFLRFLGSLGEILAIETISDAMPAAAEMDPESCYLGFEIRLQTRASKADIERVFDFVREDCELRILPPNSKLTDYLKLIEALPEDDMRIGEILVRSGALTQAELDEGLNAQRDEAPLASADNPPHIGEILVDNKVVQKELVDAAVGKQSRIQDKKAVEARLIRVQADKLDQLIDLVGEMVIAGASANLLARRSGKAELVESTSVLSRLVESIRDAALQLRMVQIGETFNRFNRVVRDVAKELGKEIDLVINGADTELDKSVVEKIGDPLMHLVRNSVDHGIEAASVRAQNGKNVRGQIELNAFHDSGSIVIQVRDDGGGLPKSKIRSKAIERGLIQAEQSLSDQDVINLIFEPGFSTADQVTNISGRGVGMDVVRRNIQSLRGSIDVSSEEGIGTTFTIRLPLTLAIIDGFLVGVGRAAYVIPLDMVVECIELDSHGVDRDFLNLRGEVLPFIRLRALFELPDDAPPRENVVVVHYGGQKAGIVVDQLMGEFQTVIKPLSSMFSHLRGIGGSTILGTGDVALILDVQALVQRNSRIEEKTLNQASLARAS
ncbi:chemotaxis protein CheA [Rhodocyclus tenuis]|uniref:chemotaxis protein CheA n=1 Tax=Rhodocyclus gracilis TaxID=2929842 RepID=UPI001298A732|nr:chemotaxis protein CheA [Rhodocyclus gracilis]MRD73240.1 chemotaxis protein CheA [Rhodocyclus gracilis]